MADAITLKDDFTFLVSDYAGDVRNSPEGYGMYLQDMRYLSRLEILLNGQKPFPLSYTSDYNIGATFRLSSGHFSSINPSGEPLLEQAAHAVGLTRRRYIDRGLVESLECANYYPAPVDVTLTLLLGADFLDMFEVRGMPNPQRRHTVSLEAHVGGERGGAGATVLFRTRPVEGRAMKNERTLLFTCDIAPLHWEQLTEADALTGAPMQEVALHYRLRLLPRQPLVLHLRAIPEPDIEIAGMAPRSDNAGHSVSLRQQVAAAQRIFTQWQQSCTRTNTDNYYLSN